MEDAMHQRCLIPPESIPPRARYEKLFENLPAIPSKDTGIDLLVTDSKNRSAVSLQVKFSKDFNLRRPIFLQEKWLPAFAATLQPRPRI